MTGSGGVTASPTKDSDRTLAPDGREVRGAAAIPTVIGRYRVLDRLGAGGMGVVWRAHDLELDRLVAIKLLHPASSRRGRARLLAEARALAQLSHPHVVTVFEVGTTQGVEGMPEVYLVMEYVTGTTLAQWTAATKPGWREVVDVYRRAGEGLQAAHDAGLVHGDFKPANVLLDERGRVVVIDFGLARITQEDAASSSGRPADAGASDVRGVPGTPAYMAAELHDGRAPDARSDQFALCVALFEALYGVHPFGAESPASAAYAIDRGEIAAPPTSKVPRRIHVAIVRGLARRPEERWPSMRALLAALSTGPRRRTWWLAALVATVAVLAFGFVRDRKPSTCADDVDRLGPAWTGERAERIVARLGAPGGQAFVELFDGYAERWRAADRAICVAADADGSEAFDRRRACLADRRRRLTSAVDATLASPPAGVAERFDAVRSLPSPDECVHLTGGAAPPASEIEERVEVLRDRLAAAKTSLLAAEYASARAQLDAVLAEARMLGYPLLVAEILEVSADLCAELGEYERALADGVLAYEIAVEAGDDRLGMHAAGRSAWAAYNRGRHEEARDWVRTAQSLHVRSGAGERDHALILIVAGANELALGEPERAITSLQSALTIFESGGDQEEYNVAATLNNLGVAYSTGGYLIESELVNRRALAIRERILGPDHPLVAQSLSNLAAQVAEIGRWDEAEAMLRRAVAIEERRDSSDEETVAHLLANLGYVQHMRRHDADAVVLLERAVAMSAALRGPQDPMNARGEIMLSDVYVALDRPQDALPLLRDAAARLQANDMHDEPAAQELQQRMAAAEAALAARERAIP